MNGYIVNISKPKIGKTEDHKIASCFIVFPTEGPTVPGLGSGCLAVAR